MRWLIAVICTAVLLTGCGKQNNDETSPPPDDSRQIQVKQSVPPKKEIKNPQEVAERLADLAASIPEVHEATCVVLGNTAIVGVDVSGVLDASQIGTIKYSVAEALRTDPYGVHAIVTADMDLYQRIQNIAAEVRAGNPVSGFANELAEIIGRIMPQIPSDIITPEEEPADNR
ncbi:YhcN/YlaJ family sporulation lipoprotein [Insulibacter thermoxylanivorax]|uniref:YhcN/YlaJ family sporulation lipoprotein n=1 Tax=Insulibacter thermoxylanivorax TaxID=2749268 RepID=UPI0019109A7A|nr:YhcN/YlaJ family sporulation lipoprotein [Insulibacter thermoxylanivorax]